MIKSEKEVIINRMLPVLSESALDQLKQVLDSLDVPDETTSNIDFICQFLAAKTTEGCSNRTIQFYKQVLRTFEKEINYNTAKVSTDDIRTYLCEYQNKNSCSNVSLDNIRRILSSYYQWLENENIIIKSPMKRIKKIRSPSKVKRILTDEELELLRIESSADVRNYAILNLLISSGIRVGELVNLNRRDFSMNECSCVVYGKGAKERTVYFDTKTKLALEKYLTTRLDRNSALFVTKRKFKKTKNRRITINTIETIIRTIGKKVKIRNVHPHIFRRSLATKAIDKGMPIELVRTLLGHREIDTTLGYAQVQQKNVKVAYQRLLA